jgi:HEAT repeat protein
VSATGAELFIVAMWWWAVSTFLTSFAIVITAVTVRWYSARRRKYTDELLARWRAVFATHEPVLLLPPIRRRDAFAVLGLWNDFQKGRAEDRNVLSARVVRLRDLARRLGFEKLALDMLRHGDAGDRLVALTTLGSLRSGEAIDAIRRAMKKERGVVALAAFRAAALIDSQCCDDFALACANRSDWSATAIERVCRELGPERLSGAFARAVKSLSGDALRRIIPFLTLCDERMARSAIHHVLKREHDSETFARALRALAPIARTEDRAVIAQFLTHVSPFVRLAAIAAEKRLGTHKSLMIKLLGDSNAWVRYRAAAALVQTAPPFAGVFRLYSGDRYGRDALAQAMAESKLWRRNELHFDRRSVRADVSRRAPVRIRSEM